MNFKSVQKKFPDAIRVQVKLIPGAKVSIESMAKMAGGGKVLFHGLSPNGRTQTIICSKQAEDEQA